MNLKEKLLKAGIEASHLDELVHEVASEQASNVNNGGIDSQIDYLLQAGWSEKDILERLDVTNK
jgi:hypothetical protein